MKETAADRQGKTHGSRQWDWPASRNAFLTSSGLVLLGALVLCGASVWRSEGVSARDAKTAAKPSPSRTTLRFGVFADSHYADTDPRPGAIFTEERDRYYRESLPKVEEIAHMMNSWKVDFLIELGDFKDQYYPASKATEGSTLSYLKTIEAAFQKFKGRRYHVLGNHDMDLISKRQFLNNVVNSGIPNDRTYYSFDVKGLHFVVLDANYTAGGKDYDHGNFRWTDANIPAEELQWLKADLAASRTPAIVFVHQRLDGNGKGNFVVNNAPRVRKVLEDSGKVLAVFQGHFHYGAYQLIGGVHYYTVSGVVNGSGPKNNSYSIVEVHADHRITVTGFRRARTKELQRPRR